MNGLLAYLGPSWSSMHLHVHITRLLKPSRSVSSSLLLPLRRDLQVFVFGPDNLIWELDKASATAENVLGRAHAGIRLIDGKAGGKMASTLVNGKAVPMHYAFKNGDVLDVDLGLAMG